MTQDIQAELRMIREMEAWLKNERRHREDVVGVSPSGPGLRPDGLSQSALSQAKPLVPNADDYPCFAEYAGECVCGRRDHGPKS
jgi:hypothetical protein